MCDLVFTGKENNIFDCLSFKSDLELQFFLKAKEELP